jgi:hypothetical protein
MTLDDPIAARLVVTGPAERAGLILPLSAQELVIGHSDKADIVLEDQFVSRLHAMVTVDPSGQVTLRDLNSTGGTFVNDERITSPRVLQPGDQVRFADLAARFEPARPALAGATRQARSQRAVTGSLPAPSSGDGAPVQARDGAPAPVPAGDGALTRDADRASSPAGDGAQVPGGAPAPPDAGDISRPTADGQPTYTVTGSVSSPVLPGVGGLAVELVDKNVGGDHVLASTQTDADGSYTFSETISQAYLADHHKTRPDLQVQAHADGKLVAASTVWYSAPTAVSLDIELPATAPGLPSEYEALAANLAAAYPGRLRDLQESRDRQDITYLANKTGWDARAVALAALADQLSQVTAPGPAAGKDTGQAQMSPVPTVSLASEFYYALLRAGLPANADRLFRTSPATAEAIWKQAAAHGVIPPRLAGEVPTAVQRFQVLSAANMLTVRPSIGVSTFQEMVAPMLSEAGQQQQFAQLYTQYQGNWARFWPAVEQQFGTTATQRLQLTGQLYYLTINNQPLVSALMAAEGEGAVSSTHDLVSLGYYDAAKWAPLIGAAIPPGIPGANPDEQASNYAKLLAAQVRVAYPTAVIADQIGRGFMPIGGDGRITELVTTFLTDNQGFEIGVEPVEAYVAMNNLTGIDPAVITQIKRLQRVYQLTPDDTSMAVLLQHNLDSALAITRYDAASFTQAFASELGAPDTATAIYTRAKQVFAATLSMAVAYLGGRVTPSLGGQSPVQNGYPEQSGVPSYPVVAYPTLENLFGSLDYCNCSDCGSILSPAAYLVDLLNYIDQPAPTAGLANPQDILFQRRPDLQYLPLTCANTNTALPYIDIVNETLEYFVANDLSLDGYQGHDTGDAVTSAELLASPQFVNDAAYAVLGDAYFPPPLPFNRALTLLRLHMANLGIGLPDAMAALRASDDLVNRTSPTSYGWSDILIEQLAISRDEYRLFTDPALQLGDLYGLANATALTTLQAMSIQDFCRRLSISYDDLTSIISTQFMNENAVLLPLLLQLDAPFSTLKTLHDNLNTSQSIAPEFIAALPAGLDATQYGGTSPVDYQAVVDWVTGPNYPLIMGIITITAPAGGVADCSGADLQLRYSNPDNTANLLSGTDFLKLIRFVRLWKKVTPLLADASDAEAIQHTDNILAALYPPADIPTGTSDTANDPGNRVLLDAGFPILLLRLGFLFGVVNQLSLTGIALDQLLACWAPIGTAGTGSLYQTMFLTPTLLQQDPGAQTATVATTVNTGDVLHTFINGQENVPAHTVADGESAAQVATAIAAAVNGSAAADPVSGLPLNSRFFATSTGGVITIEAGFTLACSVSTGASETYTAASQSPLTQTATVAGAVTPGDTLTTTIDGIAIPYLVASNDTPATIAAGVAAAINTTTVQDPYSGLPLNGLVVASTTGANGVVNLTAANAGAPFTLACSLTPANAGSYTATPPVPAAQTATITGTVQQGDTLVTTINGVAITYTAGPADADTTSLAASIAAAISADVQLDPATQLPISSIVQAVSAGNIITITPTDPAMMFTLACSVSTGAETYTAAGPFPETATATVSGTIPVGAVLTTTINTLPVFCQVVDADTSGTIAARITVAINGTTTPDPVTGLPLNSVVSATDAGPVFTLTAQSVTTPFTLAVSLTTGGYTAGRQNPPFAANSAGEFLTDQSQTLFGHQPALCAACNLTGAEFALISAELGFGPSTQLTLPNVSALFRCGWLAHTLGLSVLEFLKLRDASGLDPFVPLDPGATPPAEPPVIRFIRLLSALASAGLTTAQALYLMWNYDITGTSAPSAADVTGLASALRADFAAVNAQFSLQSDPDGSIALALMTLVYGSTASDFFFGLLNGTFTTSVPYSTPPGQPALPPPVIAASMGQLSYNDLSKQLTFAGILDNVTQTAIDAAITVNTTDNTDNVAAGSAVTFTPASMTNIYPGAALVIDTGAAQETVIVLAITATGFTANTINAHNGTVTPFAIASDPALPAALASLAAASQQAVTPFFATYPELQSLYSAYVASAAPIPDKRTTLLASILPVLQKKRKAEQALAAVTATAGSDPSFAGVLLQDPTILHADTDATASAVADLTAVESQGLSAEFFLINTPTGVPDQAVDAVAMLSYAQTATVGGVVRANDVLTTTINGVAIPYQVGSGDTTPELLAGSVAVAINGASAIDPVTTLPINQVLSAAASGSVITISGIDPSGAHSFFTLGCTVSAGATETYTAGSQLPQGPGGGPIAGVWSGYVTVPQDGLYDISVATDPGAQVSIQIAGATVSGQEVGGLWQSQSPVALVAGTLAPITLTAASIKTTLSVSWQSAGLGWQVIPGQYLYSLSLVSRLGDTYVRFLKATSLAAALSLTAAEVAYLGTAPTFAVNTTDSTVVNPGAATFTPASMANITVGSALVLDTGSAQETITVTGTTATTFSAVAANQHDGTATPFAIVSQPLPAIGEGWLNFLAAAQPPGTATAASLGSVLAGLLDFSRIKLALSPGDERLLALLADPAALLPNQQSALLSLTGWSQVSVNALLTQFFGTADPANLSPIENFRRVYDAYKILQTCRLNASSLIAAITNAPTATTVSALQSALRALYPESGWLTVVRPINDAARIAQRDALVAYILQQLGDSYANSEISLTTSADAATGTTQLSCNATAGVTAGMLVLSASIAPSTTVSAVAGNVITLSTGILAALPMGSQLLAAPQTNAFDSTDSLYEYFLIDTQTQPPVETSRIRLALSTVQLFIERVLRNLEPQVAAADINAAQWEWMKRYRVWQANREVFVWPENWLYPELRDDQSPFFQQMMSALLQGDITDDAAASAYLDYLTSLEEVAKLEPCGLYYQPGTADTDETSYVVARTAGAHRKYYFRQLLGGNWTPWTQVTVDCEDMPITPIIWNGRLFLFWLRIMKQVQAQQPSLGSTSTAVQNDQVATLHISDLQSYAQAGVTAGGQGSVLAGAVLCWSEFYNGKWQPTKTSDVNLPTGIGSYDVTGANSVEAARSQIRIVPAQVTGANPAFLLDPSYSVFDYQLDSGLPSDVLILAITGTTATGGFVLHNTHSLPARFEDVSVVFGIDSDDGVLYPNSVPMYDAIDLPDPSRSFSPAPAPPYTGGSSSTSETFTISYQQNPAAWWLSGGPGYSNDILQFNWQPRFTDSQPGLPDVWDAPFFYEDRRNLFYVTTTESTVMIGNYTGFGVHSAFLDGTSSIQATAPLVVRQPIVASAAPDILAADGSANTRAAIQRFLSQDRNINTGLVLPTAVRYQRRAISPSGSITGRPASSNGQGE